MNNYIDRTVEEFDLGLKEAREALSAGQAATAEYLSADAVDYETEQFQYAEDDEELLTFRVSVANLTFQVKAPSAWHAKQGVLRGLKDVGVVEGPLGVRVCL